MFKFNSVSSVDSVAIYHNFDLSQCHSDQAIMTLCRVLLSGSRCPSVAGAYGVAGTSSTSTRLLTAAMRFHTEAVISESLEGYSSLGSLNW